MEDELGEGEWLASDLVGCRVPGLGTVARVVDAPSCSVLELDDGTLVPFISDAIERVDLDARRDPGEDGLPRMRIDVVTLFPAWFDWFRQQRHVTNALAMGHELDFVDLRATTPLKAGQVDDTPYGGGAGMVIRVDVVEAALRERYGEAPATAQDDRPVARGPPVRRRACERAGRRARAHAALRPLRGLRRARARAPRDRRGVDRPVRAVGRRAGRDGRVRRGDAQAPGRARSRGQRGRGVVQRGARGCAGVPALHAPVRLARPRRAGRAAVRRSRPHPRVAARAEPRRADELARPRDSFATIARRRATASHRSRFLCPCPE